MQNIPDEELDELFKQAAFYHRPPENAGDGWLAMEKKLDRARLKEIYKNVKIYGSIEIGLLICILLLLLFNGNYKGKGYQMGNNEGQIVKKKTITEKNNKQGPENNKQLLLKPKEVNIENQSRPLAENNFSKYENKKFIRHINKLEKDETGILISQKPEPGKFKIFNPGVNHIEYHRKLYVDGRKKYKTENVLLNVEDLKLQKTDENFKIDAQANSWTVNNYLKMKLPGQQPHSIPMVNKIVKINIDSNNTWPKEKKRDYSFYFSILTSPDLSFTGLKNLNSVGSNIGVYLGYKFSKRWDINAGIIYSKKIYKANPADYHPPAATWSTKPGIYLEDIKADCHVIDIPLLIRYNFLLREKYNLFATTGISSYIMKKESYNYNYSYPGRPAQNNLWEIANQNSHYFSIGNLSVGYERKLSSTLSLQAEPFVKLPFAGVGYGKVKLLSTGLFISIKYKIKQR